MRSTFTGVGVGRGGGGLSSRIVVPSPPAVVVEATPLPAPGLAFRSWSPMTNLFARIGSSGFCCAETAAGTTSGWSTLAVGLRLTSYVLLLLFPPEQRQIGSAMIFGGG